MREGSLDAPIRHPLDWTNPEFYDLEKLDEEMRRVLDICHGCRRCFNLCDSFPKLFDLVDESATGELESVDSKDFAGIVEACTLCDMCFMTKCPYVPPHEFNLDFPHLMLRYRAAERHHGQKSLVRDELSKTDRNGALSAKVAPMANWATKVGNPITRPVMEKVLGIHKNAAIPKFQGTSLLAQAEKTPLKPLETGVAFGRKAVIYATCFGNYNNPNMGMAARSILSHYGVEVLVDYPGCCGMPILEGGDIEGVAQKAQVATRALESYVDEGYDIIALMPSCALMLKLEWPLILPEDPLVQKVAANTYDISEYMVELHKEYGIPEFPNQEGQSLTLHISCHSRAQNMGQKAAELLRVVPNLTVNVIERCSGHGGSWGMMVDHFETALKVGKPVARQAKTNGHELVLSECPLAGMHILQGIEKLSQEDQNQIQYTTAHPIEIYARFLGVD